MSFWRWVLAIAIGSAGFKITPAEETPALDL
jgi:hypothetical protein